MRVIVDRDLCATHGDCVIEAPEIFDLGDDDDTVAVLQEYPGEDLRGKAESAASACPVGAIRIEG